LTKNIAVYQLPIREMQSYKYQHYDKKYSVGVENFISGSKKKPIAVILIIITVVSLVLFASGVLNQLSFWVIIMIIAVIAYKVVPRMK
tara:strand:- start:30 stop:293 length:264 start_codon:yes stop_codon:yes gene_type:complete